MKGHTMSQSGSTQKSKAIRVAMVHPLVMVAIGIGALGLLSSVLVNGFGH